MLTLHYKIIYSYEYLWGTFKSSTELYATNYTGLNSFAFYYLKPVIV
jgi:hypothetical protein